MKRFVFALMLVAFGISRLKAGAIYSGSTSGGATLMAAASDPGSGDWPMWGGTPDRNMVSSMKGLPTEWDVKTKKNIKWVANLGSQSYGNPVVTGGVVVVGTNNEGNRDPSIKGDASCLMVFDEKTGKFLYQRVSV